MLRTMGTGGQLSTHGGAVLLQTVLEDDGMWQRARKHTQAASVIELRIEP